MNKLWLIILFFVLPLDSFAQKLKSDTIQQVTVSEKRVPVTTSTTQQLDSNLTQYYKNTTLQNLLQLHTNVFVKNYGVGSLSTISIRGSSAAQTQVLWEDVNVNNAMSGLTDFSSMPISFFDQMSIDYGSSIKNGAMSGSLSLSNNKPSFYKEKKTSLDLGYESLRNYSASLSTEYHKASNYYRIRMHFGSAKNQYTFYNNEIDRRDTLIHAANTQLGILSDYYFRFGNRNLLSFHMWMQHQQRDIAPSSFETISVKHETITGVRALLKWDRQRNRYHMLITLGFFAEDYKYEDSLIFLKANAVVVQVPFIQTFNWKVNRNHNVHLQLSTTNSQITKRPEASLHKAGLLASYSIDNILKRIFVKATFQQEISDVFKVPFVANISTNIKLLKGIKFYSTLSSNYRMPTLNELYFKPGGNIHLKPEVSKNIESGLEINKQNRRHLFHADIAVYNRKVKDWIAWFGSSILTPHNIQKVWSRGVEGILNYELSVSDLPAGKAGVRSPTSGDSTSEMLIIPIDETNSSATTSPEHRTSGIEHRKSSIEHRKMKLLLGMFYSYTLSTTEESAISNDYSIGKQIPYVPRYQVKGNIGFRYNQLELSYVQTYTGYRFVTTDESQYLKPYFTGNIFASYKLFIKNNSLNITARFNNIFNANYESIVGRIMPERNFSIGLRYTFRE